jgi:general secretion pathway protein D
VNTQFTYLDVGVNLEILPRVHQNNEVSLHVDLDVSQVNNYQNLGGINIPEIGQNHAVADIRLNDGEVNLIGGIIQDTNSRATTGIPGLASIPVIGRLFSAENLDKEKNELVIAIVPHVVRGIDITEADLKGVMSGSSRQIRVEYAPHRAAAPGDQPPAQSSAQPPANAAGMAGVVAAGPPATAPPITAPLTTPVVTAPPAAAPLAVPAAPGGPARISFLPGNVDTQLSQTVNVTIYAENVTNLASAAAHLQYDPKILHINNVVAADLIQKNSAPLQPSKNILNDAGQADLTISRTPKDGAASGSGGLFTIVFQAVGRGNTSVTVTGLALNAPDGNGSSGPRIAANVPAALNVNVR